MDDEKQLLVSEAMIPRARIVMPQALRTMLAMEEGELRRPLTGEERAATEEALDALSRLSSEIEDAWKDGMSAVEAVRDVRREL
jgi:hypothetical protein